MNEALVCHRVSSRMGGIASCRVTAHYPRSRPLGNELGLSMGGWSRRLKGWTRCL